MPLHVPPRDDQPPIQPVVLQQKVEKGSCGDGCFAALMDAACALRGE